MPFPCVCWLFCVYFGAANRVFYLDSDAIFLNRSISIAAAVAGAEVVFHSAPVARGTAILATDWPWFMGGLPAAANTGIMLWSSAHASRMPFPFHSHPPAITHLPSHAVSTNAKLQCH